MATSSRIMDDYYKSRVRSPADRDRDWADRDDFYRGRPPMHDRVARRRSRSPPPLDRYEPRPRQPRDDYGAARERDDRRRGVASPPPANIDRYVPGQDMGPPQPLINPMADPMKLPYQVGFSYFGEWWRANEKIKEEKERLRMGRRREPERIKNPREVQEDRERDKSKIQAAYDVYKEELQARMAHEFVHAHKAEQWFRERYVPEIRDALRRQLNDFHRGVYAQWEQDLDSGTFDEFSLEGVLKSEGNGTAAAAVDKEEGETTAASEVLGVGDLVPANSTTEFRDENLYQPTLLIKTIAPSVSRANLEAFCKENLGEDEGGFKWLSLSDPNPSKRYHRIGWIMLHPAAETAMAVDRLDDASEDGEAAALNIPATLSTAEKALEAINGKSVKDEQKGDFTCHVGVHNPPTNMRKKALWDLFSAPERIEKDLELVRRLISKFEEDFPSDFNAILKIEERVEELREQGCLQSTGAPAPAPSSAKKIKSRSNVDMSDDAWDEGDLDLKNGDEGEDDDEGEEEEGAAEDEVDDEALLVKKKQLDLMIEYLRRVFSFCFFCVFESDSVHELTRKCPGGHLRRPRSTLTSSAKAVARASALGEPFPIKKRTDLEEGETVEGEQRKFRTSKTEQQLQRAYNWVRTFEDKIKQILEPESANLRRLGGKPIDNAVKEELRKHVKQEDEHKWRCKVPECTKLFKEEHFWRKHAEKRHIEWLDKIKEDAALINAYVLDPSHIAPSRSDANSNGHFPQTNGQQPTGTPRGFNLQNFQMNHHVMSFPSFPPMPGMVPPNLMNFNFASTPGWHAPPAGTVDDHTGASLSTAGPVRRGGGNMGATNRAQTRPGPYDRRPSQRWGGWGAADGAAMGMGMRGGRHAMANRWGDGAAGGAAMGPREAVQGRTLKSYEDLDQVSGGGGGELNY